MSLLNRIFPGDPDRRGDFNYRVILDIGDEYVRAVIVEYSLEERNILAYGRAKQEYGNMREGAVVDIPGVVSKCREALAEAEVHTPYKPKKMVTGIAGEFVQGVLLTLEEERENPEVRITDDELEELHLRGREEAYQTALKAAARETGSREVLLEEINHSLVELRLDGCRVNNPLLFQGARLEVTFFYTFAPLVQLGALRTVAVELGLELEGIVAEPFALASSVLRDGYVKSGAVIIDSGSGTTDVLLLRNGGITGSRMIAAGGRSITRALASQFDLGIEEAEGLKLAYSRGDSSGKGGLEQLIGAELKLQYQQITRVLKELAGEDYLPRKIYFCGGNSRLRGFMGGIREFWLAEGFSFAGGPELINLTGGDLALIADNTGRLNGVEHTTTRSLSYYSTLLSGRERGLIRLEG